MNGVSYQRDRLTGALVGLARATFGNTHPTEDTWRLLIRGLSAVSSGENADAVTLNMLIDEVHSEKAKLVPSCAQCASPCGRNDDYDLNKLSEADAEVRALKSRLLSALGDMASFADASGEQNEETGRFAAKALFAVGEDWDAELLLPVAAEAEQLNGKGETEWIMKSCGKPWA